MDNSNLPQYEANRLIRLQDVMRMTGISRSLVYAKMKPTSKCFDATFPRPVKISKRAVAWQIKQIERWIADRPKVA